MAVSKQQGESTILSDTTFSILSPRMSLIVLTGSRTTSSSHHSPPLPSCLTDDVVNVPLALPHPGDMILLAVLMASQLEILRESLVKLDIILLFCSPPKTQAKHLMRCNDHLHH
ncbi:heat shock protein 90-1-like [Pyrus ussuriensis x Pyrus communis]|uniref:Heat shock protein 90-1-like n=1 Tax=Pyrus ussuriensis x Pyrus communis TaxID=2448454 RepID=A0A5N5HY01_9ROSA|nr:heat shock protein 90-1-like [Pyrus ussuriensis x Pyrus communis]